MKRCREKTNHGRGLEQIPQGPLKSWGLGSPSSVPDESTLQCAGRCLLAVVLTWQREILFLKPSSKDTNSIHESFTSRPNQFPKALSLNTGHISGIKVLHMNLGATQSFSLQQLPSSEDEKYLYSYRASVSQDSSPTEL